MASSLSSGGGGGGRRNSLVVFVEGQAFHVDRPLLTRHSQFFRKTLDRPENRNKHKLKLSGVSAATFAVLLKYMNTGELQVTPENVDDVFNAAFRLHMSDVVKHCIQMETETTPTGQQILMFSAARRLNMAEEEQRAYHFLTAHFMSAVATREFLELDADDVIRLLSADALGCHCEEEVFEAAMRWLNHAPGERSPHSEKLMAAVRFDHMNPSELHHCLEYPGVAQMEPVKKIVLDAI
ncbi:kelch-like protein 29 [Rhipicephalus sanguineus]|uniref:kelch-like protein 29 n=1 Tax=Rhipicephalus sanguineus TaxID=34632 RepID=UPI0020C304E0|nr:kelch-like protein 29 [Rhipicephalus sanguineus]